MNFKVGNKVRRINKSYMNCKVGEVYTISSFRYEFKTITLEECGDVGFEAKSFILVPHHDFGKLDDELFEL